MTQQEREKQVAIAFAKWKAQRYLYVTPGEKVINEFTESLEYKAIEQPEPSIPGCRIKQRIDYWSAIEGMGGLVDELTKLLNP